LGYIYTRHTGWTTTGPALHPLHTHCRHGSHTRRTTHGSCTPCSSHTHTNLVLHLLPFCTFPLPHLLHPNTRLHPTVGLRFALQHLYSPRFTVLPAVAHAQRRHVHLPCTFARCAFHCRSTAGLHTGLVANTACSSRAALHGCARGSGSVTTHILRTVLYAPAGLFHAHVVHGWMTRHAWFGFVPLHAPHCHAFTRFRRVLGLLAPLPLPHWYTRSRTLYTTHYGLRTPPAVHTFTFATTFGCGYLRHTATHYCMPHSGSTRMPSTTDGCGYRFTAPRLHVGYHAHHALHFTRGYWITWIAFVPCLHCRIHIYTFISLPLPWTLDLTTHVHGLYTTLPPTTTVILSSSHTATRLPLYVPICWHSRLDHITVWFTSTTTSRADHSPFPTPRAQLTPCPWGGPASAHRWTLLVVAPIADPLLLIWTTVLPWTRYLPCTTHTPGPRWCVPRTLPTFPFPFRLHLRYSPNFPMPVTHHYCLYFTHTFPNTLGYTAAAHTPVTVGPRYWTHCHFRLHVCLTRSDLPHTICCWLFGWFATVVDLLRLV